MCTKLEYILIHFVLKRVHQEPKLPRLPEYIIKFNNICLMLLKLSPSIVFHQWHSKIINSGIVLATSFLKWDELRTSNTFTQ